MQPANVPVGPDAGACRSDRDLREELGRHLRRAPEQPVAHIATERRQPGVRELRLGHEQVRRGKHDGDRAPSSPAANAATRATPVFHGAVRVPAPQVLCVRPQ
jgi:hypothetical protein